MRKRKQQTADEFVAQLRTDRDYQARVGGNAAIQAEIEASEKAFLEWMATRGYPASSLDDLFQRLGPSSEGLTEAIVDGLSLPLHVNVIEALVRALGNPSIHLKAGPLVKLFERTPSPDLRWAIANTFAEVRPTDIRRWLLQALADKRYGKAREMLALAVARTCVAEEANQALLEFLLEMPGHAALALAETAGERELDALRAAYESATGWEREQVGRTIDIVSRRTQEKRPNRA